MGWGCWLWSVLYCFFFNDTATTEIYTLSLHDALPIWPLDVLGRQFVQRVVIEGDRFVRDRKSGSAGMPRPISYAVFCLTKQQDNNHYESPPTRPDPRSPHTQRAAPPP